MRRVWGVCSTWGQQGARVQAVQDLGSSGRARGRVRAEHPARTVPEADVVQRSRAYGAHPGTAVLLTPAGLGSAGTAVRGIRDRLT